MTQDLSRARNGFRVGGRIPIAVVGRTYGLDQKRKRCKSEGHDRCKGNSYDWCDRCGARLDPDTGKELEW